VLRGATSSHLARHRAGEGRRSEVLGGGGRRGEEEEEEETGWWN